jgi:ABC-type antimicrobial peptide transport system permease subunit
LGILPVDKLAYATGKIPNRVVGVVADVRESGLEQNSSPEIYVPMTQNSDVEGATLVVRSRIGPDALGPGILAALRTLNPSQPATGLHPLQSLVDHSVSPRRFFVLLVTIFATLGILLAALGIYGVISYSVTQKTQEIGVRMALGATRGRVRRAVLAQTLRLAIAGLAAGTLASLGAARLIASLLFATSPWDPVAYAAMGGLLLAISLLSGYFPARRASKIEPMTALRSQ